MKTLVENKFSEYFENWVGQLEEYFQFLHKISAEDYSNSNDQSEHEAIIAKLKAHHKGYYTAKWAAAHEDVLAFFSPVWLSPIEKVSLWYTGWKPSMAFRLIDSVRQTQSPSTSLAKLTQDQLTKIQQLRIKIRIDEQKVERDMERQQVSLGYPPMVELARLTSRVKSGDSTMVTQMDASVEVALKGLLAELEKVMKMADCVRLKTLKGVLDVLSPKQCVDFLAAISEVQIEMRKLGKKRENCQLDDENATPFI